jgi:hypothetical protein
MQQRAIAPFLSVLASFLIVWTICRTMRVDASPAILAAGLAVGLSRGGGVRSWRAFGVRMLVPPLIAVAAAATGLLFAFSYVAGAALFTSAVSLSVLTRRRLLAVPFIAPLAVPVRLPASHGLALLLVIAAGLVAALCTAPLPERHEPRTERPARKPGAITPEQRMSAQMAFALAAAFTLGGVLLPAHWFWVVLTAFIVCSGAIARGDAIYKGALRLAGAFAGTLVAALCAPLAGVPEAWRAVVIFAVLLAAMLLRDRNYAYWAAGITLLFALLMQDGSGAGIGIFWLRLAGIALGALCASAAVWLVFPIRTSQLVRRRAADVIAAHKAGDREALALRLEQLERAAAPAALHRRLFRRWNDDQHPAAIADRAREFVKPPAN